MIMRNFKLLRKEGDNFFRILVIDPNKSKKGFLPNFCQGLVILSMHYKISTKRKLNKNFKEARFFFLCQHVFFFFNLPGYNME